MTWTLKLERQREWPAKTFVDDLAFRDPTLAVMRRLPQIERVRTLPDRSTLYEVDWEAVDAWLRALIADEVNLGLIDQLMPVEAERAKTALLGFFGSAAADPPRNTPPTTSSLPRASGTTRIE
ncbi:MAG: hypothetical protein GY873_30115 [Bosea sp.]|uniref:hypothetical protein n=1 Tax=Bosea sp. (in: a-proteobacteria) TaxID=1871050 RepID=UPI00238FC37F|nr:hypothetical protein [Bosea sp. (in: a-proteobacteria)]MCP4738451.1 hypothetical protein [Bosea sp. (in: a-proteobacteria)]